MLERSLELEEWFAEFDFSTIATSTKAERDYLMAKPFWYERRWEPKPGISISGIFSCPRSWYYASRVKSTAPIVYKWKALAAIGDVLHGAVQDRARDQGKLDKTRNGELVVELTLNGYVLSKRMEERRKRAGVKGRMDLGLVGSDALRQSEIKTWKHDDYALLDQLEEYGFWLENAPTKKDQFGNSSVNLDYKLKQGLHKIQEKLLHAVAQNSTYGYLRELPEGCVIVIDSTYPENYRVYRHDVNSFDVEMLLDRTEKATLEMAAGTIPEGNGDCTFCGYWNICDSRKRTRENVTFGYKEAVPNVPFADGPIRRIYAQNRG